MLPFLRLSYGEALIVWSVLGLAFLGASVAIIVRELEGSWSWSRFLLWGAAGMAWAPFVTVAATSEMTFFLMVPFTLAWRSWRRGRWVAAGGWLGLCASVKLFLLLLVLWMAYRFWRLSLPNM